MDRTPRFDPSRLDRAIHSPIRLGVVAALHTGGEVTFSALRKLVGATDGNLTIHLQVLEQNGVIKVRKRFVNRRPQTSYRLTDKGRLVFRNYVACMARMVEEHSEQA
jgi:DNA-binding HxlR family transcriptional regulator